MITTYVTLIFGFSIGPRIPWEWKLLIEYYAIVAKKNIALHFFFFSVPSKKFLVYREITRFTSTTDSFVAKTGKQE